ncbi:MAG: glycosyl transferase group 1 [Ignavibacteria bacterium]|nr:MAG: glycosyl transferase group 1 [Ignavibacteria bacterium]KAF0161336.1 MAG: glycosyl transferase group 1 [Ignavibacteria bacterium]
MASRKKICLVFLGNPFLDSRITNLSNSLHQDGYSVSVIGFDWFSLKENFIEKDFKVFRIFKPKLSLLFYLQYNFILLKELIKTDARIYFAEDFYTLPLVTFFAKLKSAKVFYNSREIYAYIGGLHSKPYLQKLITEIERFFIKKVDLVMTTGELDSEFLEKFYSLQKTSVIRNIPLYQKPTEKFEFRKKYNIADDKLILLYQGIIIPGRGIEKIIRALSQIPNVVFVLLGNGEQKENYFKLAQEIKVEDRVVFAGAFNQKELINYTSAADVGLSLIENISISYYHALPNKLFEYIMAELPVISSNLPQMKRIVETYKVGEVINPESRQELIDVVNKWTANRELLTEYKKNCQHASRELNWQKEYERFRKDLLSHI